MSSLRSFFKDTLFACSYFFSPLNTMRRLPKILIHEHLDCSLRPFSMLEMMSARGSFPEDMPSEIVTAWAGDFESKKKAAALYQTWLGEKGSESLTAYIHCIINHLAVLMQTVENLQRITRERIEDAVDDGIIGLILRFAPQLCTYEGLTMDEVMDAVISASEDSPIPIKFTLCALRHENGEMAEKIADLCIKYKKHIARFDLAADETSFPGVLDWWLPAVKRVQEAGIEIECHIWESNDPTEDDVEKLLAHNIKLLGHGFRGNRQGNSYLGLCPTSNVVTGQFARFEDHVIDVLFRQGSFVTVNTDGLTLTKLSGLSEEFHRLRKVFRWGLRHFYIVTKNANDMSTFDDQIRAKLTKIINRFYL